MVLLANEMRQYVGVSEFELVVLNLDFQVSFQVALRLVKLSVRSNVFLFFEGTKSDCLGSCSADLLLIFTNSSCLRFRSDLLLL